MSVDPGTDVHAVRRGREVDPARAGLGGTAVPAAVLHELRVVGCDALARHIADIHADARELHHGVRRVQLSVPRKHQRGCGRGRGLLRGRDDRQGQCRVLLSEELNEHE